MKTIHLFTSLFLVVALLPGIAHADDLLAQSETVQDIETAGGAPLYANTPILLNAEATLIPSGAGIKLTAKIRYDGNKPYALTTVYVNRPQITKAMAPVTSSRNPIVDYEATYDKKDLLDGQENEFKIILQVERDTLATRKVKSGFTRQYEPLPVTSNIRMITAEMLKARGVNNLFRIRTLTEVVPGTRFSKQEYFFDGKPLFTVDLGANKVQVHSQPKIPEYQNQANALMDDISKASLSYSGPPTSGPPNRWIVILKVNTDPKRIFLLSRLTRTAQMTARTNMNGDSSASAPIPVKTDASGTIPPEDPNELQKDENLREQEVSRAVNKDTLTANGEETYLVLYKDPKGVLPATLKVPDGSGGIIEYKFYLDDAKAREYGVGGISYLSDRSASIHVEGNRKGFGALIKTGENDVSFAPMPFRLTLLNAYENRDVTTAPKGLSDTAIVKVVYDPDAARDGSDQPYQPNQDGSDLCKLTSNAAGISSAGPLSRGSSAWYGGVLNKKIQGGFIDFFINKGELKSGKVNLDLKKPGGYGGIYTLQVTEAENLLDRDSDGRLLSQEKITISMRRKSTNYVGGGAPYTQASHAINCDITVGPDQPGPQECADQGRAPFQIEYWDTCYEVKRISWLPYTGTRITLPFTQWLIGKIQILPEANLQGTLIRVKLTKLDDVTDDSKT